MNQIERGFLDIEAASIEVRDGDPGTAPVISGYAAVYDSRSGDLGGFVEIIRRGAFDEALKSKPDVLCRVQHAGGTSVIGATRNGTLRLWTDTRGLRYECSPPDTTVGRDVVTLIRRGDIAASSFAFSITDPDADQRWDFTQTPPLRELLRVNLHDVAPVDVGAYPAASVGLRAAALAQLGTARRATSTSHRPILSVDFDGVLHNHPGGYRGADVIEGEPVDGMEAFLRDAVNHFDVHIFSARSSDPKGVEAMRTWLSARMAEHYQIEDTQHVMARLNFPNAKPCASVILDDRAIPFNGTFPTLDSIRDFRPWHSTAPVPESGRSTDDVQALCDLIEIEALLSQFPPNTTDR